MHSYSPAGSLKGLFLILQSRDRNTCWGGRASGNRSIGRSLEKGNRVQTHGEKNARRIGDCRLIRVTSQEDHGTYKIRVDNLLIRTGESWEGRTGPRSLRNFFIRS